MEQEMAPEAQAEYQNPIQQTATDNASVDIREVTEAPVIQAQTALTAGESVTPQIAKTSEYIYVAGKLKVYFPTVGLEKECEAAAQELGVAPTEYYRIFSHKVSTSSHDSKTQGITYKPYRYIAEQVSWILTVDSQDAYVLVPQSVVELNEFIDCLKPVEGEIDHESYIVAIGDLGPVAPKELSDQAPLHMVRCNHLYPFSYKALEKELTEISTTTTSMAISNVLNMLDSKKNLGRSNFDRAKNFIAYRYPTIYLLSQREYRKQLSKDHFNNNASDDEDSFLVDLKTRYSESTSARTLVDIIFTYQKKISGRQFSYYLTVDTSEQFPFLHSALTNYVTSN